MVPDINKIMVSLLCSDDEGAVLDQADHIITEHGAIDKSKLADYCTT